ncbi:MAG: B12-binding domain-containing radical SAM protein [Spirochaetota bacterium]
MRILLVSPAKNPGRKTPRYIVLPQLALQILAGLTPREHQVTIVEEEIEDLDLDTECDLVGISCMTANVTRGYCLAREFKARGKTVVMGGVHPTLLPDEALRHADSVVIGEAEGVWERLLEDFTAGRLERTYHHPYPSLDRFIQVPRRKVLNRLFQAIPVMTTRGCPYNCEFCSVHGVFGNRIRHVPVENVARTIAEAGRGLFLFLDDNIAGDPAYARRLFEAITPLHIRWAGQASFSIVKKPELLKLAAASGCSALFFGVESVSESQLKTLRKSMGEVAKMERAIRTVEDHGIYFHASMIFGFDTDTLDIFPRTLDFLERNRISSASLNILTPYPGTAIYRRYREAGRLLTRDWRHYNHKTVVFTPRNMTPFELQAGRTWVFREFNRLSSILRRLPAHLNHPLYHLAMNLGHRVISRRDLGELPEISTRLFPPPGVKRPDPSKEVVTCS